MNNSSITETTTPNHHPPRRNKRRWFIFTIAFISLILVGWQTVSNNLHLDPDHLPLTTADYIGYAVCHRITDRSFAIAGRQLPLCARCTGMYLGFAFTFLPLILAGRRRWASYPHWSIGLFLLGLIAIMGFDGLNSYSHFFANTPRLYTPSNELRLLTGMGTGLAMGIGLFPALAETLWKDHQSQPILNWGELISLIFLLIVVTIAVLSNQPVVLYVMALVSALGLIIILTSLNMIFLMIALAWDAQATRWQQLILPIMGGLLITITQIALIDYIRYSLTGTLTGIPGLQ
ncbi:MAG TPA: DUF2085 domain-containing protein [Anaerolineae bacterium]|nr:DUF2085 domain-containing protein [Anaerolineae bacterium]